MKWIRNTTLLAVLVAALSACVDTATPDGPPAINYRGMTKNSLMAGSSSDSLQVSFHIKDENGDVSTSGIYFIDSRDSGTSLSFNIPLIEPELIEGKPLDGILFVDVKAAFLRMRDTTVHKERDTLTYTIYVKDNAGNESNRITTDPIYLFK